MGAKDSGRKMVFSGERSGDQSLPTEYEGDTFGKLLMKGGGGEGGGRVTRLLQSLLGVIR